MHEIPTLPGPGSQGPGSGPYNSNEFKPIGCAGCGSIHRAAAGWFTVHRHFTGARFMVIPHQGFWCLGCRRQIGVGGELVRPGSPEEAPDLAAPAWAIGAGEAEAGDEYPPDGGN